MRRSPSVRYSHPVYGFVYCETPLAKQREEEERSGAEAKQRNSIRATTP